MPERMQCRQNRRHVLRVPEYCKENVPMTSANHVCCGEAQALLCAPPVLYGSNNHQRCRPPSSPWVVASIWPNVSVLPPANAPDCPTKSPCNRKIPSPPATQPNPRRKYPVGLRLCTFAPNRSAKRHEAREISCPVATKFIFNAIFNREPLPFSAGCPSAIQKCLAVFIFSRLATKTRFQKHSPRYVRMKFVFLAAPRAT